MRRALVVQDMRAMLDHVGRQDGEFITESELETIREWVNQYVDAAAARIGLGRAYENALNVFHRAQAPR